MPEFMRKIWKDTSSPEFSCSELELSGTLNLFNSKIVIQSNFIIAKLAEFLEWPIQYRFEKVKQSEKANIVCYFLYYLFLFSFINFLF